MLRGGPPAIAVLVGLEPEQAMVNGDLDFVAERNVRLGQRNRRLGGGVGGGHRQKGGQKQHGKVLFEKENAVFHSFQIQCN
jgi:hypothetical protein